jgi:hypothetical protein
MTTPLVLPVPLAIKFNSDVALYDAIGSITNTYVSMTYDTNYIYFLNNTSGSVTKYDIITESISAYVALKPSPTASVYSVLPYKESIYGFEGYAAKQFIDDTVLYIKDNNKLIQESFNRSVSAIHLSSRSQIRDFMLDEDMNYYVLHGNCTISKFTKDRIPIYSFTMTPNPSSAFNALSVMPNEELQLLKIDYVREYTDMGLKEYPIVLGRIKNGTGKNILSAGQMFLAKIDENYIGTVGEPQYAVSQASMLPFSGAYYPYGDANRVEYNLTNYEYLKNKYPYKRELAFKIVLQNIFNNRDKNLIEIPISTDLFESETHHFAFRMNGVEGKISVFLDGNEIKTVDIVPGQYIFQNINTDAINVGNTYFHNNIALDKYMGQKKYYYINNATIKQFKMYNRALTNNEIKFHVYRSVDVSDLVVSLPCDQRNELDGIERQFKLNTTGNKSNKINLIIKNSQIKNVALQNQMKDLIMSKLENILPATTTIHNIEFR